MTKERAIEIASKAVCELIYGGEDDEEEMREWCMREFNLTDAEASELEI